MRIGVDATCWANGRGYGRFARELMHELIALAPEHEFVCIGDASAFAALRPTAPNVRCVVVSQDTPPTDAASAAGHRSLRDMWRLTRATAQLELDVFFSPSVYTFFPLRPGQRAVVTIHDAIAERFPHLTLPSARARLFWRLKVALAIRQARLILSVSEYAASQVAAAHGIPAERMRVAVEAPSDCYQPASTTEVRAALSAIGIPAEAPYFTYVGGFSPHKRLDVIIRAHAALAERDGPTPHLALVGRFSGDAFLTSREALLALIQELGTTELVHWCGYQPDETVCALHTGAVASVLVSESEGFGLPAVEAAACGTPVIATTESPLPQLLAGGGVFIKPGNVAALTNAMATLLDSPQETEALGRRALVAARKLTWRKTAEATLAVLLQAGA